LATRRRAFGGLHTRLPERATELGLTLPVCRVIVNQAHCFATGGSFDNALLFSLSMAAARGEETASPTT
jgi:hypothetical protein